MAKKILKKINEHAILYRDDRTGIAWIEDGSTGLGYSCHANISDTGSIRGMKDRGYWGKKDRCVRTHGFIYNIDTMVVSSDFDKIVAQNCRCEACVERLHGSYENPNK